MQSFKINQINFLLFSLSTSLPICFVKICLKFWVNLFHKDWSFKGPKFQTKPFFFLLYNLQCFIMRLTFPLVENLGQIWFGGAAKFFSTFAEIFFPCICFLSARIGVLISHPNIHCWLSWYQMIYPSAIHPGAQRWSISHNFPTPLT